MLKILPVLLLVTVTYGSVQAQVGIGTSTPNNHAVLELKSPGNNQGLLAPALTTAQRTAPSLLSSLGSSENGLLVYDSDDQRFYFWKDTNWEAILSGAVSGVGTVLSVGTGTGLSGGPITSTGTISLANTTVSPGTYGSATQVSQFAVDAQGRITSASNVAITGAPPTGTAGGDLTGTFPNPGVASIRGNAVSATAPTTNQILKWNGSAWTPAADANSGGTVTSVASGTGLSGGPITGAGTISLANTAVTPATYGDATHVSQIAVDAQGRITSASSVTITGAAPTGSAGGDLTGNYPNPTITTNAVTAAKIAAGDYSTKINTGTYSISITGNAATATNFSGALAGDVIGTQAATLVTKLYGYSVSATAPTTNQILKWNGSSWLPSADANSGGTVTSVASGTGLTGGPITGTGTISLANTAVTPATYGDATHVSQIAVDAQGRITSASSVTITGAAPTGSAGGDLTGNYPNPTITTNAVTAAKIAAGDYSTKINTGTYSISITGNAATATTATNFSGALAGDVTGTQGATVVGKLQGSAVSATAPTLNQILKWNGSSWLPSADANSGGTVTSVATSARLTGGPITATGTLDLATSGVTAATYGSATLVPQIAVDSYGRITSAGNIAISGGPPSGAAGGALTGTYPNPTIATGAVTTTNVLDGTIADIDISTTAAIADSKLATITTAGKVSGDAITSGTITGTTIINTTGSITSSKSIAATNSIGGNVISSTNNITTTGTAISGVTAGLTGGYGVFGQATGQIVGRIPSFSYAVYGTNTFTTAYGYLGGQFGVYGNYPGNWAIVGSGDHGVHATGTTIGVYGAGTAAGTYGVYGDALNTASYGVYGSSSSTASWGVYGSANQVGSYGVFSAGQAGGTTGWVATSDLRFKRNIQTLSNPLARVLRMRGVSYEWRVDEFPKKNFSTKPDIGVIAQEIKEILPEVVFQDGDGYYSVSYEKIVPILIEAIKEQQKLINEQDAKIQKLGSVESELSALKAKVDAIEKYLSNLNTSMQEPTSTQNNAKKR